MARDILWLGIQWLDCCTNREDKIIWTWPLPNFVLKLFVWISSCKFSPAQGLYISTNVLPLKSMNFRLLSYAIAWFHVYIYTILYIDYNVWIIYTCIFRYTYIYVSLFVCLFSYLFLQKFLPFWRKTTPPGSEEFLSYVSKCNGSLGEEGDSKNGTDSHVQLPCCK